jgi:hypothetical protein
MQLLMLERKSMSRLSAVQRYASLRNSRLVDTDRLGLPANPASCEARSRGTIRSVVKQTQVLNHSVPRLIQSPFTSTRDALTTA